MAKPDEIDYTAMIVTDAVCCDAEDEPRIGVLTIETVGGLSQVLITEPMANVIIQQLRDFLSGEAKRLP
jgi:hypothetical protein